MQEGAEPGPLPAEYLLRRLMLVDQSSYSKETQKRENLPYEVAVVVKHSPFQVTLALDHSTVFNQSGTRLATAAEIATTPVLSLSQAILQARLIYDTLEEKVRPIPSPSLLRLPPPCLSLPSSLVHQRHSVAAVRCCARCEFARICLSRLHPPRTCGVRLAAADARVQEVDFVKLEPMEYKTDLSKAPIAVVEVKLKVLTSQLEDMNFRIRFSCLDPTTEQPIAPLLACMTGPIKVISKPEQQNKGKKPKKKTLNDILLETLGRVDQQQRAQYEMLRTLAAELNPRLQAHTSPPGGQHLGGQHLGDHQLGGQQLLPHAAPSFGDESLGGGGGGGVALLMAEAGAGGDEGSAAMGSSASSSAGPAVGNGVGVGQPRPAPAGGGSLADYLLQQERQRKKQKIDDDRPLDFETAVRDLVDAFDDVAPADRVERVRGFIERSGLSGEYVSELHDLFCSEGLEQQIGSASAGASTFGGGGGAFSGMEPEADCLCEGCPHRAELQRIEEFYKEVFSLS